MASPTDSSNPALKCPVCSAGFRDAPICLRCGTNLQMLMQIAARAWALRQQSAAHLREGDLASALRSSAQASQLQQLGAGAKFTH